MLRIDQLKLPVKNNGIKDIKVKLAKQLRIHKEDITRVIILRRSVDARDESSIFFVYNLAFEVSVNEKTLLKKNKALKVYEPPVYRIPFEERSRSYRGPASDERIIVTGAGPAGLFSAYGLALAGYPPLLIERGKPVEERLFDVKRFWQEGVLDPSSNVQFGEGGAGTFSDGKLNTLIKDRDGSMRFVLETFVKFGAPEEILYDYKPHVGTDILMDVIKNMRQELLDLGCEIRFSTKLSDIDVKDGKLSGITVESEKTDEYLPCSRLILACGHSARDTFYMLHDKNVPMLAKEFAVGLRIEHPREFIDRHQFGSDGSEILGAAPYKLATKLKNGRGVYSFCMCPGGYVVNSSSEEGHLAVNGMSYSRRDGDNSNSAIVVSVGKDEYDMNDPLSGIEYQRSIEAHAYRIGGGKIPQQLLGDFKENVSGKKEGSYIKPAMSFSSRTMGESVMTDLSELFSREINLSFLEGMEFFDRKFRGFSRDDAILSGVESRTSSPVRIVRDESFQSDKIRGFYPCGEGAGYAGGITSAAMDGLKVAKVVVASL